MLNVCERSRPVAGVLITKSAVTGRRGSDLVGHGRDPENPPEDPISVEHSTEGRVTRGAKPIGHNFPKRVWGR